MTDDRLQAWFEGDLEDDELTDAEVRWLQQAVFAAVARKTLERPGVHCFPGTKTVQ